MKKIQEFPIANICKYREISVGLWQCLAKHPYLYACPFLRVSDKVLICTSPTSRINVYKYR